MQADWKTLESGLFFIIGTGRCGTTLLQAMLSQHSRLLVPLETGFLTNLEPAIHFSDPLSDSDIDPYLDYCIQYWWWPALGIESERFCQLVRGGMRSAQEIFLWLLWQLAAGSGKVKIGEKTIGNWRRVDRILELFPKAKLIHIYRDPRDVVASLLNQEWWTAKSVVPTAIYCREVLAILKVRERNLRENQLLQVKYEILATQPELELKRICNFLDEEFEPQMLRFDSRSDRGYVDAEADWKDLTLKPLTKKRIGVYRELLTPQEIWTVERILGKLLIEYDYEPDSKIYQRLQWWIAYLPERIKWGLKCFLIGGASRFVDKNPVLKKLSESLTAST